jgi:DNA-binding MarR family transcriptional regulator
MSLREIDRLLRLAHEYRRAFPRGGYQGLNPLCLQVLLILRRRREMSICDIATALHSARPTISNTIAHLTHQGFLIESGDEHDRRLRYQRLSALGIAVADAFLAKVLAHEIPW